MSWVIVIFLLIASTFAELFKPGPCPKITVDKIDLDRVSGIWYEHKRSINNWDDSDECGKITWNKPEAGVSIIIYNSLSKILNVTSTMTVESKSTEQGFIYHLPIVGNMYHDHYILGTDYDNYGVVWLCENYELESMHIEKFWVFTREPDFWIDIEDSIKAAFDSHRLEKSKMVTMNNQECSQKWDDYLED